MRRRPRPPLGTSAWSTRDNGVDVGARGAEGSRGITNRTAGGDDVFDESDARAATSAPSARRRLPYALACVRTNNAGMRSGSSAWSPGVRLQLEPAHVGVRCR